MTIKYKFSGLHIDTGSGLVHAGNVEEIAPLVEEESDNWLTHLKFWLKW